MPFNPSQFPHFLFFPAKMVKISVEMDRCFNYKLMFNFFAIQRANRQSMPLRPGSTFLGVTK